MKNQNQIKNSVNTKTSHSSFVIYSNLSTVTCRMLTWRPRGIPSVMFTGHLKCRDDGYLFTMVFELVFL